MTVKQFIGLIGSILLIVGVFTPILKLPIVGTLNYFQNGKGDGTIILILGIISIILVLFKKYSPLIFTGILSFGVIGFTFFNIYNRIGQLQSQMNRELSGNPFRGLADAMVNAVQIEWGFALLVIGALLLTFTPVIKENSSKPE